VGQKKPGAHGFAVDELLAVARQKPAAHGRHEEDAVNVAPPEL
jgi:hypothetical protein